MEAERTVTVVRKRPDAFQLVTVWASGAFLNRPVSVTDVTSRAHATDCGWVISETRDCFVYLLLW